MRLADQVARNGRLSLNEISVMLVDTPHAALGAWLTDARNRRFHDADAESDQALSLDELRAAVLRYHLSGAAAAGAAAGGGSAGGRAADAAPSSRARGSRLSLIHI